jgi:hypothetical protein
MIVSFALVSRIQLISLLMRAMKELRARGPNVSAHIFITVQTMRLCSNTIF